MEKLKGEMDSVQEKINNADHQVREFLQEDYEQTKRDFEELERRRVEKGESAIDTVIESLENLKSKL